jgi:zinc protease
MSNATSRRLLLCLLVLQAAACQRPLGVPAKAEAATATAVPPEQPSPPAMAPAPADDSFRATPPAPGPLRQVRAPVPVREVLENGLTVLVVPKRDLPLVHVDIVILGGASRDPAGLPGLAAFVADMLKEGTKTRDAKTIADEVESLGASLDVGAEADLVGLSFTALAESFTPVLSVAADVLRHSVFSPTEIERVRKRRLAALAEEEDDPPTAASNLLLRVVMGDHPYGHPASGTKGAVAHLGRGDLVRYADTYVRPGNCAVVLVGDLTPEAALAAVRQQLGSWKGRGGREPPVPAPLPAPVPQPPIIAMMDRREAPQTQVRVGELGVARTDADYFPLLVANDILGGMFNSRINQDLREDKGLTYGAASAFDFWRAPGPFYVAAAVRTDGTGEAVRDILQEIERMRTSDVSERELLEAKNSLSLSLPGELETVGRIAGMMANLFIYDLPLDYYTTVPERISAVDLADVRRVAVRHWHPERLSLVVVGDRALIEADLAKLGRGTPVLRTPEGRPR